MSLLKIAQIGHPVLRQTARTLTQEELAGAEVQTFIDNLVETMRDANGAGLAATQVYNPIQVCAIEVKDNPRYPYKPNIPLTVMVNPVITMLSEETFENFEGCLSVPNLRGRVMRNAEIRVNFLDRDGQAHEREVRGITAGTYQHEVDHLFGKIFVDHVFDSKSLCTWTEFERHHRDAFVTEAEAIVARWGG